MLVTLQYTLTWFLPLFVIQVRRCYFYRSWLWSNHDDHISLEQFDQNQLLSSSINIIQVISYVVIPSIHDITWTFSSSLFVSPLWVDIFSFPSLWSGEIESSHRWISPTWGCTTGLGSWSESTWNCGLKTPSPFSKILNRVVFGRIGQHSSWLFNSLPFFAG